ncbi:UvrD-helicase domain-containing protein [Adlercreutzia sp. ZJ304]|uniref:UvrD-helicase domain-containing protein n=1 Tax=Adlercreutzia sp. ZJ304 TaxID=2709791 RepID=UPI0013E9A823|nr:UvrD-helicase domain-containing protein [Adlercreutzia sp. ZJ304]
MDTQLCTSGQLKVIKTLDRPLMVSAGAGSGKTFTLTQRIVEAIGEDGPLSSIEEICAITYTNAAAAELRSRIKALLLQEGMPAQARMTDNAWISTIHSMAARILRENAIRIGIDPGFEIIDSTERDILLARAIDEVAANVLESDDERLHRIVKQEPLVAQGSFGRGIMDDVAYLLSRVRTMPDGFDGIKMPTGGRSLCSILSDMIQVGRTFLHSAQEWSEQSSKDIQFLEMLSDAVSNASSYAESNDADLFREMLYAFPHSSKYRSNKNNAAFMECYNEYRACYAKLSEEAECTLGIDRVQAVIDLAKMVDKTFSNLKGKSRLDNDDLLRKCHEALINDSYIAESYRDRFKLIMIDEFQDTDKLQTAIVSALAKPDLSNVCTVGDAQQSIYRFRGADVNVFLDYKKNLKRTNSEAVMVELPDNFRSHGDILKMVDAIFASEDMFGSNFLHLEARGAINNVEDAVFANIPRVNIDVVHYQRKQNGPSATSADALQIAAKNIAAHFAKLHENGAPASDMALLLGGMSNAQTYAEALREVGLEAQIVAGSIFQLAQEAQLVADLLRVARNIYDEEALLHILMSSMFAITDDVLLALASRLDDGAIKKNSIASGFIAPDKELSNLLSESDLTALNCARCCLKEFMEEAQSGNVSYAMRRLLLSCGLLDRLQREGVEGLAAAGNFEKACRLIEILQKESCGIAEVSRRYIEHLRLEKETPGLLAPIDGNYVTIMTIHGSKGLEFPHVAVAELNNRRISEAAFVVENIEDNTYVCGKAKSWGDAATRIKALKKFRPAPDSRRSFENMTIQDIFAALSGYMTEQVESESKRLLYVGLTRAVKSIFLSLKMQGDPKNGYDNNVLARGLYRAFSWQLDCADSVSMVDFGGSTPAKVSFTYLPSSNASTSEEDAENNNSFEEDSALDKCAEAAFEIPIRNLEYPAPRLSSGNSRSGMYSYTSLSSALHADALKETTSSDLCETDKDARTCVVDADKATDLGTAFHRLAQQSIERASASHNLAPVFPEASDICAQERICNLSDAQKTRLESSISRWLKSKKASEFFSYENIAAEVPFCVAVGSGEEKFYLVGEIDGLAHSDEYAHLIDYKTGGMADESSAHLHEKHLLQAQCYAFALLSSGYSEVSADFIRVEQSDIADISQPQIVSYRFNKADLPAIENVLIHAQKDVQ